jgi:hypothetical protein
MTTDRQVRKLMDEMTKRGRVGLAADMAGMDRKTARKYLDAGQFPSALEQPRTWRTREDPFEEDWPGIEARLEEAPGLEAKTIFELLVSEVPGRYQPGQLRSLQRRIREWRARSGPPKEVFFSQLHRPGEAMQTDFTHATELSITIAREPFAHLLCHPVLPYSNWEWATVSRSESLAGIKRGVQAALFRLGRVPKFHQTDNSTGATHDLPGGKRGFNKDYLTLMTHFGMEPRTIEVGASEQNGDVEALNGALKRRLEQHLLVRGNRDFETVEVYEKWIQAVLQKANELRCDKVAEEMAVMRVLVASRLAEYLEEAVTVSSWSTISIQRNAYSVPSRLIGEEVRVRVYEDHLEGTYGGKTELSVERLLGRSGHRVNYRHIIWSLVQKPGAFARYRYREDLFPSLAFRKTYDALRAGLSDRKADVEYLRILHLAASTLECDVETALKLLLDKGPLTSADQVKALLAASQAEVPDQPVPQVDLTSYDALLELAEEVAS